MLIFVHPAVLRIAVLEIRGQRHCSLLLESWYLELVLWPVMQRPVLRSRLCKLVILTILYDSSFAPFLFNISLIRTNLILLATALQFLRVFIFIFSVPFLKNRMIHLGLSHMTLPSGGVTLYHYLRSRFLLSGFRFQLSLFLTGDLRGIKL